MSNIVAILHVTGKWNFLPIVVYPPRFFTKLDMTEGNVLKQPIESIIETANKQGFVIRNSFEFLNS